MRLTKIKLRRLERGLLQVELSQRAQIPRNRLSEIENAHVAPKADELERLAAALRVPIGTLSESQNEQTNVYEPFTSRHATEICSASVLVCGAEASPQRCARRANRGMRRHRDEGARKQVPGPAYVRDGGRRDRANVG